MVFLKESGQGMAFLYFTRTGGLAYNIRVEADDEVKLTRKNFVNLKIMLDNIIRVISEDEL